MDGTFLLIIHPNETEYPSVGNMIRQSIALWNSLMPTGTTPDVLFVFGQSRNDLFLSILHTMDKADELKVYTSDTQEGSYYLIGPASALLTQNLKRELGSAFGDASLISTYQISQQHQQQQNQDQGDAMV